MANCLSVIFLALLWLVVAKPVAAARLSGVVDSAGVGLADVVVTATVVKPKKELMVLPVAKPVTMALDQKSKEFIPHVLVVKAGTPVFFPNSDDIQHHVYSFSTAKRFEIKLYKGTPTQPIVFDQPGVVALGCNIHDWMLAFIVVTDTPYFAKTDASGHWEIDVPDGEYRISLWHADAADPEHLPSQLWRSPTKQLLQHTISIKSQRQTGKPPDTLQLQGYKDGF